MAAAEKQDFRPLIYVIPFEPVKSLVEMASLENRAHALSEEYIIERLPRELFDAIEIA